MKWLISFNCSEMTFVNAQNAQKARRGIVGNAQEHIPFFLEQFRNFDYTNRECRRLVEIFVSAVFLYDDGTIKIAFNFSEKTISDPWI
ncbi:MAG: hypothetical protein HDR27_01455 [Lachnospiraceae bacterium]|nr:hypothetical protein [Lachnospiraceae bacterium]